MNHGRYKRFQRKLLPLALSGIVALGIGGCMGPKMGPVVPDTGWDTSYEDALSPHTQLALGTLEALKKDSTSVKNTAEAARKWQALANLIEAKADGDKINAARRDLEGSLGQTFVDGVKAKHYTKSDLMSFMMNSGMKIPKGGISSLNPDHVAATKVTEALAAGGVVKQVAKFEIKAVAPEEALSPVENLMLGTALLLERERDSYEMSQIFRLALYSRPLRRVYDPNPELRKINDPRIEAVYMDRIWRVLKPEQVMKIREWNLTKSDLQDYITRHHKLPNLDPAKAPATFTLIEYVVNDFHEQIAPQVTLKAENKPNFYIPESLLKLTGREPGDGKKLYEGICAACHGVDGQGRFPEIAMRSYLSLHSDHEHHAIVAEGPPQKPDAPVVMPTFSKYLSNDQINAIVKHIRKWESMPDGERRNEKDARTAGVKFYDTPRVYEMWKAKSNDVVFLDVQSDIAYRIMGHIPGSVHTQLEKLDQFMKQLPKDKEIIVMDMFGSQGIGGALLLAKAGYKASYLSAGMVDWHIQRNLPVTYE